MIIAWKISLFKTLFLLFKYVTSETKEFFATKTNALLVGTLISVDYVCVSIALAVAKGRKVYKNHKENTNFTLPLAEIRVLFCLIYLLASFWGPQFECATQESRCKKKRNARESHSPYRSKGLVGKSRLPLRKPVYLPKKRSWKPETGIKFGVVNGIWFSGWKTRED